jgi:O-antigen/teichoic acid export membrane protein
MTHPAFYGASVAVGLSASAQFFMGVFSILTTGIYFARETRLVSYIQGATALVSVPLNYALVRWWGVAGAAAGSMLNSLLLALFLYGWNRLRGGRYLDVAYDGARIARFAGAGVLIAGFTLLKPGFSLPVEAGIASLEALVVLALAGSQLTPPERKALFSRLPFSGPGRGTPGGRG